MAAVATGVAGTRSSFVILGLQGNRRKYLRSRVRYPRDKLAFKTDSAVQDRTDGRIFYFIICSYIATIIIVRVAPLRALGTADVKLDK